ncbi:MAG TPA: hypothetical protein VH188_07790 [Chthoniobacterales bacterium]|nr:hypothetical protein [Chthoniobacterales bacterium]
MAAKARLKAQPQTSRKAETRPEPPSHRQLAVAEILALPFPEFYEALRAAPGEARQKWAAELEKIPPGPQRRSAVKGFYKLLVQFDPKTASTIVSEITDKDLQSLAVSALVDAAPGFAMRDMAELILHLSTKETEVSNSFADVMKERQPSYYFGDVISEWISIDPAAVARFYDEHPKPNGQELFFNDYREVIIAWAAIDPKAARDWMEKSPTQIEEVYDGFISGWYINDPAAAVSYVLSHATEPILGTAVSGTLSELYLDSKDEAKKFIEALPDGKARHDAIQHAFASMARAGTAEETGEPERTPRVVAEWVTQFPPDYWNGTLRETFERWTEGPPEEVVAWIQSQSPEIEAFLANEYKRPLNKTATEAITTIVQFAEPNLRDQLITAMFRNADQSLDQDKDSIAAASFPPEQKNHLLQIIARVEAEKSSNQNAEE